MVNYPFRGSEGNLYGLRWVGGRFTQRRFPTFVFIVPSCYLYPDMCIPFRIFGDMVHSKQKRSEIPSECAGLTVKLSTETKIHISFHTCQLAPDTHVLHIELGKLLPKKKALPCLEKTLGQRE